MKARRVRSQSGFSITELLVAMLIGSVTLAGVATLFGVLQSQSIYTVKTSTRDVLLLELRTAVLNPRALAATLNNNPTFRGCVRRQAADPVCLNNFLYGLTLYDASGMALSGPDADESGNPAQPACFDMNGTPCPPASPNCAFRVTTAFRAQMPPEWGSIENLIPFPQYPRVGAVGTDYLPEVVEVIYSITATAAAGTQLRSLEGSILISPEEVN